MTAGNGRKQPRLLIIGLDGADWRLLRPWLAAGQLPTLARLVAEGASGPLRSTIRPESSVAWSSFATGVNPGKHGIFGFMASTADTYQYRIANGSDIRTPRFWDILGRADLRSVLLNVPFTYPPRPFSGWSVTGMMTPNARVPFTHPPDLGTAVRDRWPNLLFDAGDGDKDGEKLAGIAQAFSQQQSEMALWLLDRPWDCFTVVFTAPDRLQHFAWQDNAKLLALYQQLDHAIDQLLTTADTQSDRDTITVILSDHGFNACSGRIYINAWLEAAGWLTRKQGGAKTATTAVALAQRLQSISWLRALKRRLWPSGGGAASLAGSQFGSQIDWGQTRAFFTPDGGIRLNVRGREPDGIIPPDQIAKQRDALIDACRAITLPDSERPLFAAVYARDDLYTGTETVNAPDIILEPQREAAASHFVVDGSLAASNIFGTAAPYQATHATDGIAIVHGASVIAGKLADAQIIDLAPSILAWLGLPVPRFMDGKVWQPFAQPVPTVYSDDDTSFDTASGQVADTDPAVADRLRQLGYIE